MLARALWLVCLLGFAANTQAVTVTNHTDGKPMIITLCAGADADGVIKGYGLKPTHRYRRALNGFAASISSDAAAKLKRDSRVMSVEPDGKVMLCDQTNGTGIIRMGVTNFPIAYIDGNDHRVGVDVAVIDSGIQTNHPDLNVYESVGFTASGIVDDTLGHGTHVAGIVGALDNNIGVVGVAPGVRLWSVKVFEGPSADWSTILVGMDYVASNADQIAVVNASFSGDGFTSNPVVAIEQAVSNIVGQGAVFVAAAGNSSTDLAGADAIYGTADDVVPAALPEAMAVSAMDPTSDTIADFSNFSYIARSNNFVLSPGLEIDVAAPGVNILSTWINSGYAVMSGTSMAAPHVAGLVALYIAANGRATNAAGVYAIRQALVDAGLPQSQWNTTNTMDPDYHPEPLAICSEKWVPSPVITNFSRFAGSSQIYFVAVPGYDYTVLSASGLTPPIQWTNVSTVSGSNFVSGVSVADTNAASVGFYRLVRSPSP